MSSRGWTGVDLDGTLAVYEGWHGIDHIGEPVPAMVARVKQWLSDGREVRIFTARVSRHGFERQLATTVIERWCYEHLGRILPVTCEKDLNMVELWDDRCVQVEANTGARVDTQSAPCPLCGEHALATATCDDVAVKVVCFACMKTVWKREEVEALTATLLSLQRAEGCWCECGIGNPTCSTHSPSCKATRALLGLS